MNANAQAAVIYQAEPMVVQALSDCRRKLHHICGQHIHRRVQVRMDNGQTYVGTIAGFDDQFLYLNVSGGEMRPPVYYPFAGFVPYSSSILPLVLFNLLTISLLY